MIKLNIVIFCSLLVVCSCASDKFIFSSDDNDYLTNKESIIVEKCIEERSINLKDRGVRILKNKVDNRFYLGTKNETIVTMFEINCENIDLIFNDTIQEPSYDKIFTTNYSNSNLIKKISHGFKGVAGSPGMFNPRCEFNDKGKLERCYEGRTVYEIDSITRQVKISLLGF